MSRLWDWIHANTSGRQVSGLANKGTRAVSLSPGRPLSLSRRWHFVSTASLGDWDWIISYRRSGDPKRRSVCAAQNIEPLFDKSSEWPKSESIRCAYGDSEFLVITTHHVRGTSICALLSWGNVAGRRRDHAGLREREPRLRSLKEENDAVWVDFFHREKAVIRKSEG